MTDVVQAPIRVNIAPVTPVITIQGNPPEIAVRLLETSRIETERIEHIVVQEPQAGLQIVGVGAQGPAGRDGTAGSGIETYIAAVDLGGHRVIVTDANGKAIYADNTNPAHANMATKITLGAASTSFSIDAQIIGRITEPSWTWVVGGTIYVGANGTLTQTPPAIPAVFSKPIAVAETPTRVLLIQEPPIML